LPRGQIPVPAPAIQQRVVGRDADAVGERGDRFAILPDARLRHAQRDDLVDVVRIRTERTLGPGDGPGVTLGSILDARG